MCLMKYEFAVLSKCVDIALQPFCKYSSLPRICNMSKQIFSVFMCCLISVHCICLECLFIYFFCSLQHMTEAKSSQEACQLRMRQERSDSNIHSFPKGKTKNMPFLTCCGSCNLFSKVIFLLFVGLN